MDRLNPRQFILITLTLALTACASSSPRNEDSGAQQVPAAGAQTSVATATKEPAPKAVSSDSAKPVMESQATAASAEPSPPLALKVEPSARVAPQNAKPVTQAETVPPVIAEKVETPTKAATPAKVIVPTEPNTFIINAGIKDQTHPFYGIGDKRGFLVNGQQGKTLVLTRGEVYKFNVDTGVQHDFYFTTSERGWGAGTLTEGIEGQFTYEGTVTVKPGASTPVVIYYQCRNHKSMGGKIHVINKGEKVNLDEGRVAAVNKSGQPSAQVTDQQVQQKLTYAKMLMTSASAKRIKESDNAEAKELKTKANALLASADTAFAAKKNGEAMESVDEALRMINAANLLAPSETAVQEIDYKSQYDHQLKEIEGYKKSYKRNLDKQGTAVKVKLDEQRFESLLGQAKELAGVNNYKDALTPAKEAAKMITDVVSVMLNDSVVVYDKEFASPKEEFEFELSRYESYLELIPIAKEQRQPNPGQLQLMDQFVEKAQKIAGEGADIAKKGDYALAIQAYQAATDNLNRALMLVGVR